MAESYTATFETGRPYRVHHSYIWLGPFMATWGVFAVLLMRNFRDLMQLYDWIASGGGPGMLFTVLVALAGLAVVYAVLVGIYALGYRNLSYVFDERELSVYSGIITKRRVHVPYQRVQSVNHRAGLMQRIFGLCTVSIDTAGGASNKAVRIPYVQLAVGSAFVPNCSCAKPRLWPARKTSWCTFPQPMPQRPRRWPARISRRSRRGRMPRCIPARWRPSGRNSLRHPMCSTKRLRVRWIGAAHSAVKSPVWNPHRSKWAFPTKNCC